MKITEEKFNKIAKNFTAIQVLKVTKYKVVAVIDCNYEEVIFCSTPKEAKEQMEMNFNSEKNYTRSNLSKFEKSYDCYTAVNSKFSINEY
jgi:hypothetical protein